MTSWRSYTSGKKWNTPGGDFGPEIARASVPAMTSEGTLTFDVTDLVREHATAGPTTLSVVILEIQAAPTAPSELAFTSLEGDASKAPALLLSDCEP